MRFRHLLLLIWIGLSAVWSFEVQLSAQQEIAADITQAENFYYEARFDDALTLLASVNDRLHKEPRSTSEQAKVSLLIGLCQLALDDVQQARSHFLEFCVLDPDHSLDEKLFPPKVVSIIKEMDSDCSRCVRICSQSQSLIAAGNLEAAADLKSREESCPCTWGIASNGAQLRSARELLEQKKYPEALKEYQALLSNYPANTQLRDAVNTVHKEIDQALLSAVADWRDQFSSRQFERAAETYQFIRSLENDSTGEAREAVLKIRQQYEMTFQDLITSWNSACMRNDEVSLNAIRAWSRDLDPNRNIQPDAFDRMRECRAAPASTSGDRQNVSKE